ncbi:MAG: glycoside hydrolase family 32 protein [Halorubrum sp.]
MSEPSPHVGVLHDGALSPEQTAATEWLHEHGISYETLVADELESVPDGVDVCWWHRDAPLEAPTPLDAAAPAIEQFLTGGGGVLLSLRAMAAVDALSVETVPPDVETVEATTEPTGLLWRSVYADHPSMEALEGLRHPVRGQGTHPAPTSRYESVLPERGEILASTICGDNEIPERMTVVSWGGDTVGDRDGGDIHPVEAGGGAVLGVGAPITFGEPLAADEGVAAELQETRDRFLAGCLRGLADDRPAPARPTTTTEFRALRERVPDEQARPAYHLTAPANWLNDPNGLIRWNGRYHVFYQYNPGGPFHNTIHWGHAVSDDLVEWTDQPVALSPTPDGPDRDGCWSGCAVDDDGVPTIVYTGGRGRDQLPCLATADDPELRRWTKHETNPIIGSPPSDLDILETDHWRAEFRDHCVWRDGGTWYQLIGTGLADGRGAVLLYTATNLREWSYEGPVLIGPPASGTVWECPELLDVGERQLLHVSDYENVVYFLGTFENGSFEPDTRGVLDHGELYAPQSLRDGSRTLTWGWIPEAREVGAQWDAGWSGALSLPRVITTGPDGRLRQYPAPELTALRDRRLDTSESFTLDVGERRPLDAASATLELSLDIAIDDAESVVLSVLESPDRAEHTRIRYTRAGDLVVERDDASRDHRSNTEPHQMAVSPHDEPLSLRVFVDRSVVELYANDRHCLTTRVYPTRQDAVGVSLRSEDGRATVSALSAWELGDAFR